MLLLARHKGKGMLAAPIISLQTQRNSEDRTELAGIRTKTFGWTRHDALKWLVNEPNPRICLGPAEQTGGDLTSLELANELPRPVPCHRRRQHSSVLTVEPGHTSAEEAAPATGAPFATQRRRNSTGLRSRRYGFRSEVGAATRREFDVTLFCVAGVLSPLVTFIAQAFTFLSRNVRREYLVCRLLENCATMPYYCLTAGRVLRSANANL
jgi:hypothetical protein